MQKARNSSPAVSVIIPNYNHARYLWQRIESVLTQRLTNFELIILDDASVDGSVEIIKRFASTDSRISFYPSAKNSGSPFIQWNKGVRLAKAKLIWIAESDDTASPDFLEKMVNVHSENKDVSLSFCESNRMNDNGEITGSWKTFTDNFNIDVFESDFVMRGIDFIESFLIVKNVIPNASGVVFKKSIYNEVGGTDETLKTNSDWLTWLKLLLKHDVAFVAEPLNNFRYHAASVIAKAHTSNEGTYKEQYDLSMRRLFEKYCDGSNIKLSKTILDTNRKYMSYDYGNKGIYLFKKGRYLNALTNLIRASTYPKPTLGYFRRLVNE